MPRDPRQFLHDSRPDIIAVVGPTASGKTALAIDIAEALDTEIVSADSMQFYRGMEIGSGAPSADELARVRHHFVSFLDPGETMSAGRFESIARPVIDRLNAEGRVAIVVGGSGLYIRALIDGLIDGPSASGDLRARLAERAESVGAEAMYRDLVAIDPAYAAQIDPNDLRRIVRALEVYELTGKAFSAHHAEQQPIRAPLECLQIAIDWPRAELYERINRRVEAMFASGFVEEVETLLRGGQEANLLRLRALGYREIIRHLRGGRSREETVELIKQQTRRYAKRQLTWFRADTRIEWISPAEAETFAQRFEHAAKHGGVQ